MDWHVLTTDYENFALMYHCRIQRNLLFQKKRREHLWLLTRYPFEVDFEEEDIDLENPELQSFMAIKAHAMEVLAREVPDYPFDAFMR